MVAADLVAAATYDGDTPTDQRSAIRRAANVILTNPDMLHVGILPHHGRWADFFHRLRYVVVDELHTLRGIFGTHVSMVLRRLRRLCHHYGSDRCSCSARAIGNGKLLYAVSVAVVDERLSPRRACGMWNPGWRQDTAACLAEATSDGSVTWTSVHPQVHRADSGGRVSTPRDGSGSPRTGAATSPSSAVGSNPSSSAGS